MDIKDSSYSYVNSNIIDRCFRKSLSQLSIPSNISYISLLKNLLSYLLLNR